jgi:hypothetical protein
VSTYLPSGPSVGQWRGRRGTSCRWQNERRCAMHLATHLTLMYVFQSPACGEATSTQLRIGMVPDLFFFYATEQQMYGLSRTRSWERTQKLTENWEWGQTLGGATGVILMTHQTWFDQHAKEARLTRTRSALQRIMIPHEIISLDRGHSYPRRLPQRGRSMLSENTTQCE